MALSQYVIVLFSQDTENTAFSSSFPLTESLAKAFCWLLLSNFKEKTSTIFYDTA